MRAGNQNETKMNYVIYVKTNYGIRSKKLCGNVVYGKGLWNGYVPGNKKAQGKHWSLIMERVCSVEQES